MEQNRSNKQKVSGFVEEFINFFFPKEDAFQDKEFKESFKAVIHGKILDENNVDRIVLNKSGGQKNSLSYRKFIIKIQKAMFRYDHPDHLHDFRDEAVEWLRTKSNDISNNGIILERG